MTGNDIGVSIFVIILGLLTIWMAFKYNKNFHHNYVHTRLGSGEAGGTMLLINVLKFSPYWVYRGVLFLFGISLLSGISVLIFHTIQSTTHHLNANTF